ncbi:channel accessory protein ArfB [Luteipulveratus flavus]|uniref:Uncharacterized protein n=1 Tax=Luteipulveratus flavus TaxID=3031728 RepID=A0ABT6CA47_9MICO|nr:hypothetical protein [Luteipulveratus sp. YIM 133296]MDF8265770.1 hypothetical protein [Luteipulveratus sp. YIM 133296]
MGWLFAQSWFWMLIAFVVGALVAWLLVTLLVPTEREAFAEIDEAVEDRGGRS